MNDAIQHALKKGADDEGLSMELELHFACQELKNMDVSSLTDSAVVLYAKTKSSTR